MPPVRIGSHLLFGALLAWAAAFTLDYLPAPSGSLDGAFYFHVARHVADGDGLTTTISRYHHFMAPLPHESNVYPLWPLLLGMVGRLIDLEVAAALLPKTLYLLDLALLYILVDRVCRRLDIVGVPLAAVIILAVHPPFVFATSEPYTEGLGLAFTLGTLLAVDVSASCAGARTRVVAAAAAGLCTGLAYATRFQMICLPVALCFVAWRRANRRPSLAVAALFAVVPMAVVMARLAHLPGFKLWNLLDYGMYRSSDAVPPMRYMVEAHGLADWLRDKVGGLAVAFDPWSSESYCAAFGVVALAVLPAAALLFVPRLRRRAFSVLRRPEHGAVWATLATGFVLVAPLHLAHSRYWIHWTFGWRQSLPFIFLLVPALGCFVALAAKPRLRLLVSLLVLAVVVVSALPVGKRAAGMRGPRLANPAQVALAKWLDELPKAPIVLAMEPEPLAALSRNGRFYWTACWDDPAYVELVARTVRLDYVAARRGELGCPALASLRDRLVLDGAVAGYGLFTLKDPPSGAAPNP